MNAQSRIDPSSAAHNPVIVNSSGVPRALLSATYCNEKSCEISAHSITTTARNDAIRTTNT